MKQLFFLCFALFLGSCAKSTLPVYPANWTKNWPEDSKPSNFDTLSKVAYEVQRDDNNIYLHLSTKELASQMRILRYGLTISLDPTAQKKDKQSFTFPIAVPDSAARGFSGRPEGRGEGREGNPNGEKPTASPTPEQMQQRMLNRVYKRFSERPKEIVIKGFEGIDKKTITLGKDPSDIQVDLELGSDNTLNYYAVIPIKKFFGQNSNEKFSVGIVSGFMVMDENSGPPMGGGIGGGGGQPQMSEEDRAKRREFMMKTMEQMTTPIEIWFNVDLKSGKK